MLFLNKCDLLEKKLNSGIQWVFSLSLSRFFFRFCSHHFSFLMIFASFLFRVIKPNETVSFRPIAVISVTQNKRGATIRFFSLPSPPVENFLSQTRQSTPSVFYFVTLGLVFFFLCSLTVNSPIIYLFCRLTKYVRSYGDRNNDLNTVSKCMSSFPAYDAD